MCSACNISARYSLAKMGGPRAAAGSENVVHHARHKTCLKVFSGSALYGPFRIQPRARRSSNAAEPDRPPVDRLNLDRKGTLLMSKREHLDFRLESGGRKILGIQRQVDRPPQPDLVDLCRASRLFDLAGLEHRRDQAAAGRLQLHDRPAVPARRDARADRLADALSLHLRGDDVRRPQLDDL